MSGFEYEKRQDLEHLESGGPGVPKGPVADEYNYVPGSPEEKALVRKIDRHVLPMLWVMYIFNYIDRTNIGVSYDREKGMTGD